MINVIFSLILFTLSLLTFSHLASAEEDPKELPPLNPKYMGVHGMKLFNKGSSVYASHMLSLETPKNVQILYKLDINELSLLQLVKDADLVTIKPEAFNLQRLMRGEEVQLFGLLALTKDTTLQTVLHGTHSKHASIKNNSNYSAHINYFTTIFFYLLNDLSSMSC